MDYSIIIAPLVAIHAMIPPLSVVCRYEEIPPLFSTLYQLLPPSVNLKFVQSLTLDPSNITPQTLFTHMLVHQDYNHLLSNLLGLLLNGFLAHNVFGFSAAQVYAIYLFGGAFAVIPRSPPPSPPGGLIDEALRVVKGKLKSFQRICGASGGVMALIGANTVMEVVALTKYTSNQRKHESGDKHANQRSLGSAALSVASLMNTFSVILRDWEGSVNNEKALLPFSQVHHEGHLQGFVFGASFAALFGVLIPSFIRSRKNRVRM